jgi:hypothetical protein
MKSTTNRFHGRHALVYLTCILTLSMSPVYGQMIKTQFKSLSETYQNSFDRLNDPVEVEYIIHRCAAVFSALAVVFESDAKFHSDDRSRRSGEIGKKMTSMAEPYIVSSIQIATTQNKTERTVLERIKSLTQVYLKVWEKNVEITNQGLSGLISADGETCKDLKSLRR